MTATRHELTVDSVEVAQWGATSQGRKPVMLSVSASTARTGWQAVQLETNVTGDAAPQVGQTIMVTIDWQPE